jgi:hypothetical protein
MFDPREMPILSGGTPIGEGENLVRQGIVSGPTISQGPASLRMGGAEPMTQPVVSPQGQFGRNVNASLPPVGLQPQASQELPYEQAPPARMTSAYDQYAQPSEAQQKYEQLQHAGAEKHKGGKWARIKDILMTGIESGFNPIAMSMVGVNPQIRHNRIHDIQTDAAAKDAEVESQLRARRMAELENMGQTTGVIPGTDQPTEAARQRMVNAQIHRDNAEDLRRHRIVGEGQAAEKQTLAQKRFGVQAFKALTGARNLTPEQAQEAADNLGIDLPEGFDPQVHDLKVQADGQIVRVGRVGGSPQATGVTSFDATKQAEQRKRTGIMQQNADTNRQRAGTYDRTAGQGRSGGGVKLTEGDYKTAQRYETAKHSGDPDDAAAMSRYRARLESKGFTFDDKGNMTYPPRAQKQAGQGNRTPAQKTISATSLPALLNHADVKARGIKDINGLRKDLAAHGYTIVE